MGNRDRSMWLDVKSDRYGGPGNLTIRCLRVTTSSISVSSGGLLASGTQGAVGTAHSGPASYACREHTIYHIDPD